MLFYIDTIKFIRKEELHKRYNAMNNSGTNVRSVRDRNAKWSEKI